MTTYETLEQALGTKKAILIKSTEVMVKGVKRKAIQARKGKGKRTYYLTQYENGMYSSAV